MISLLITLIVLCLVFGILWYAIGLVPLPPPFGMIVRVLLLLVLVLVLLEYFLPLPMYHGHW